MVKTLLIGPNHHLTAEQVAEIARNPSLKVALSVSAERKVRASRKVIERMVSEERVVYGVTTGFGSFKNKFIAHDHVVELQRNLLRSHATGVGPLLAPEFVRAALVVRLNSLAQGYSGVRLELLQSLCRLINRNVVPAVPSQGSVGSSGDLAPLSHMGLVLMGEGKAFYRGRLMSGRAALKAAKLTPVVFNAKEGLAWNNGTSVMTGIAATVFADAQRLPDIADAACALSLEAFCGMAKAFDARVHNVRPHPGQQKSASHIRRLIRGSRLVNSVPDRIQDSYSLRCASQVHGAVRDAFEYVGGVIDRELNSVTDNPLIFMHPDEAVSGGNFHGEPIAIAMDTLGIALAELADISERRTAKLVDAANSEGLPAYLIAPEKGGLHSGFMIPQYVAAALVSENKVLAHPASVDSIPTSSNQEDHVSMGTIAARKSAEILRNVEHVLAIELMTAAQGVDFRDSRKLGEGTKALHRFIRKTVPHLDEDREFTDDITSLRSLFLSHRFRDLVLS